MIEFKVIKFIINKSFYSLEYGRIVKEGERREGWLFIFGGVVSRSFLVVGIIVFKFLFSFDLWRVV